LDDQVVGTYARGILTFDANLNLLHDQNKFKESGGLNIFQTKDHTFWLTDSGFLRKLDHLNAKPVSYITPARVMCTVTLENDLAFGTKKGLYLFKGHKFYSQAYKNPLLKSPIVGMVKDENNDLWLATVGNGVLLVRNDTITQFQKKDGLTSNICTAITQDQYNNIWVGTNAGLTCIKRIGK
jgi:hypothetical protein